MSTKKKSRTVGCIASVVFIALVFAGQQQKISAKAPARTVSNQREEDENPKKPASARAISVAVGEFRKTVNGKASVRNRCQVQGSEIQIEESSEVTEIHLCKLVVRTIKMTRFGNPPNQGSAKSEQSVEFMIYPDLSDLTTPVLVEPQTFAGCDASAGVLKVSSRSDPKRPMEVIRRSEGNTPTEGNKQTRRDLSLFFADRKVAKTAAEALRQAIKACGGKEWPDEDDLP